MSRHDFRNRDFLPINWRLVTHAEELRHEEITDEETGHVEHWWHHRLYFVGGTTLELPLSDGPHDVMRPYTIIAAEPGYMVIEADGDRIYTSPVVAWRCYEESADPITLDHCDEFNRVIQCPDGTVIEQDIATYESVDDWRAERAQRAARAAKLSAAARKVKA